MGHTLNIKDCRKLKLPGRDVTMLVGAEKMQSDRMTFGVAEVPPEGKMLPHTHIKEEEIMFVLEGYGAIYIDGKEEAISPGTVIKCNLGEEHYIVNKSDKIMKFTFCFNPPVKVGSYDKK